jgi:hypothetical protein
MRDFTLAAYARVLDEVQRRFGGAVGILQWQRLDQRTGCVIRHDVDRRPANALRMAALEQSRGIRTTYYFRVVGSAFNLDAMRHVQAMGHEVGYHYEDLALARGDGGRALESFSSHLATLRKHVDVKTVAMHGSPLSRFNNLEMWKSASLADFGLEADAFLTVDYRGVAYFTDTGRDWSGRRANLRDCPPGAAPAPAHVQSTFDLAQHVSVMTETALAISAHPERWDDRLVPWTGQLAKDSAANRVKQVLRIIRRQ